MRSMKILRKSFPRQFDIFSWWGYRPTSQKKISLPLCPIHENTLRIMKITKEWGWKDRSCYNQRIPHLSVGLDHPGHTVRFRKTWKTCWTSSQSRLVWFPPLNLKKFTLRASTRRVRHTTCAAVGGDLLPTHFPHFLGNLHLTKNSHVFRWVCQSNDIA